MQETSSTAPGASGNETEAMINELRDAPEAFAMLFAPESE
jgi:hypothetical protein